MLYVAGVVRVRYAAAGLVVAAGRTMERRERAVADDLLRLDIVGHIALCPVSASATPDRAPAR